jgi:nucleoside-diphosphate-sugar epimerase
MTTKLIFGCGYLGERVARLWRDAGHEVFVVTRSAEKAKDFQRQNYQVIRADVTRPGTLSNLPNADTVLFSVGYDHSNGQSIADVYAGGVGNVLAALSRETDRFIHISTTGIYGDANGDWVDELTPPNPQREGGRASLAAERVLAGHPLGSRSIALRLAGIYGPGRIPFLDELRAAEPIPAPTSGHLNLIHVDDAATIVVAAGNLALFHDGPRIYCVSDGHPVERGEYYAEVARQIGGQPPRFVDPDPNSPRTARARTDRRIRNDRMMAELRVKLEYPDYRAGLATALETQAQQSGPLTS